MDRIARLILFFLLGTIAPTASAALSSSDAGTASGQFLKLGADARGDAMAGAMSAAATDAAAIYWNPAGLAELTQRDASMTHALMYQSVFYDFMAFGQPLEPLFRGRRRELEPNGLGTVAFGILYLNAGTIQETDNTGTPTGGAFTPTDLAAIAGWGGALMDSLEVGMSFKYISSHIESNAVTGALDFGARYKLDINDIPLVFSGGARNIGGQLKYHLESDPIPAVVHLGIGVRPLESLLVSFEEALPNDNAPYSALGTEVHIPVDPAVSLAFRAGYSMRATSGLDGPAGLSLGTGIGYAGFTVDYAWMPFGALGSANRFTLSYRF